MLKTLLIPLLLFLAVPDDTVPNNAVPDDKADEVAQQVIDAMGGAEAWTQLRYLAYTFASERDGERSPGRRHLWDRHTGDYRLEWTDQEGTEYIALFNVNTRQGAVYADGTQLDDAAATEPLASAYRSFINDMYWLLMPVKLLDPGVNRTYDEEASDEETDVIHLTFGDVGLTPGDQYWVYVDRESHLVRRWAFVLERNPDAEPRVYDWLEYHMYGPPNRQVMIAARKAAPDGSHAILTDEIDAPETVDPALFREP